MGMGIKPDLRTEVGGGGGGCRREKNQILGRLVSRNSKALSRGLIIN